RPPEPRALGSARRGGRRLVGRDGHGRGLPQWRSLAPLVRPWLGGRGAVGDRLARRAALARAVTQGDGGGGAAGDGAAGACGDGAAGACGDGACGGDACVSPLSEASVGGAAGGAADGATYGCLVSPFQALPSLTSST